MGGSFSCDYVADPAGHEGQEVKEAALQKNVPRLMPDNAAAGKAAASKRTGLMSQSDMRKALNKKEAQERWAKTKAEWQANVTAEIEAQQTGPSTEPDRYGGDERMRALQAIREEEEAKEQKSTDQVEPSAKEEAAEAAGPEETPAPVPESSETAAASDADAAASKEPTAVEGATDDLLKVDETAAAAAAKTDASPVDSAAADSDTALLDEFLRKNGFEAKDSKRKRSFRGSAYPVHLAAEQGDARIIRLLLEAGADKLQKDSSGRTSLDIAKKRNRKGSHDEVVAALS